MMTLRWPFTFTFRHPPNPDTAISEPMETVTLTHSSIIIITQSPADTVPWFNV